MSYIYTDSHGNLWAPVQYSTPQETGRNPRRYIPWTLHELVWAEYAEKYGRSQDAMRIAERGGFSVGEIDKFGPRGEKAKLVQQDSEGHGFASFEEAVKAGAAYVWPWREICWVTQSQIEDAYKLVETDIEESLVEEAARAAHTVNKIYCESLGDASQVDWLAAPGWQRESCRDGARSIIRGTTQKPSDSHVRWLEHKRKEGWVYGPVKDPEKREHPCMVAYEELPDAQKVKDHLFFEVVRGCMRSSDVWSMDMSREDYFRLCLHRVISRGKTG